MKKSMIAGVLTGALMTGEAGGRRGCGWQRSRAGAAAQKATTTCQNCHGPTGDSATPHFRA